MSFSQDYLSPCYWTEQFASPQLESPEQPKPFCDSENVNSCINYLSKEMTALGLPPLYKNGSVHCDNIKLVNAIYSLLERISFERRTIDEFQERLLRLSSDLDIQRSQMNRLQERLENSEKGSQGHQEKHRQVTLKNKAMQSDLKVERDECRRLQSMLQQRDAQFHHEHRRKERELCQLKERLHQAMSQRTPHQVPGMTLSNGIPRKDGRRGTWTTKAASNRNEEDLQKRIISSYEKRNHLLLEEVISLRETLVILGTEAKSLLQDESLFPVPEHSCDLEPALSHMRALSGPKTQATILETWRTFRSKLQMAQGDGNLIIHDRLGISKQRSSPDDEGAVAEQPKKTLNTWIKCDLVEPLENLQEHCDNHRNDPTESVAVADIPEVSANESCATTEKEYPLKEELNLSKLDIEQKNLFRHRYLSLIGMSGPFETGANLPSDVFSTFESDSGHGTPSTENVNRHCGLGGTTEEES